ncbi:MAG: efflux RND transporter periplasmic adaptor subunit [Planctomycetaceae bacterium]
MTESHLTAAASTEALNTADAIEALLSRLEAAARLQREPEDFFPQLLREVLGALSATSGAIWCESDQGLVCLCRLGGPAPGGQPLSEAAEHQAAAAALLADESQRIAPNDSLPGESHGLNATGWMQCFFPRPGEGVPGVVLRVGLRPDLSLNARETASGLLSAVADIALSYQLQHRLRTLQSQEVFWRELDTAAQAIHAAKGRRACARTLAEQVRRLVGCDRASLLIRRGSRCRLAAISSATDADRRARQVRLLEAIASDAVQAGSSFQIDVGRGGNAYRVSEHVDAYLDETQLRSLHCELLIPPQSERSIGCLVVESYQGEQNDVWDDQLRALVPHAATALSRALDEESRGWRRLLSPWRWLSTTGLWLLLLAAVAAAIAALTMLQTDLTIEAPGRLMPVQRRGVFAPADAIVSNVLVTDGTAVIAGQSLATLLDPDLELEFSRLSGELETAAAKLDAVQARRKLLRGSKDVDASLLSIEEGELKATVAGLEQQLDVVRRQREQLTVVSPIAGRVARWDLGEVLQSLPVRHGQSLMDVYDPAGAWRLELQIPDDVAGYVRMAVEHGPPLVHYVFQTEPGRVYSGELQTLADATELTGQGELSVRGLVPVTVDAAHPPRRGASVVAKITCGRRSVGFVWFRELIEFVQRRILF